MQLQLRNDTTVDGHDRMKPVIVFLGLHLGWNMECLL